MEEVVIRWAHNVTPDKFDELTFTVWSDKDLSTQEILTADGWKPFPPDPKSVFPSNAIFVLASDRNDYLLTHWREKRGSEQSSS